MKPFIQLILLFSFSAGIIAQTNNIQSLVQKSTDACSRIKTVKYDAFVKFKSLNSADTVAENVSVTFLKTIDTALGGNIRIQFNSGSRKGDIITYNGNETRLQKVSARMLQVVNLFPTVVNAIRNESSNYVLHIITSVESWSFYQKDIENFSYNGTSQLDGVDCQCLTYMTKPNKEIQSVETKFWIGDADFVPRKMTSVISYMGLDQYWEIELSNIRINTQVEANDFTLIAPPGYLTQTWLPPDRTRELIAVNSRVPDFDFELLTTGTTHSIKDYRGKLVIIEFWNMGCSFCMLAGNYLEKISTEFKPNNVEVIAINPVDTSKTILRKFTANKGFTYQVAKVQEELCDKFGVESYPNFFLIDPEGKIIFTQSGYDSGLKNLSDAVRKYLETINK